MEFSAGAWEDDAVVGVWVVGVCHLGNLLVIIR